MILDTSAALAIAFGEPGFEQFAEAVSSASPRRISAASFLEASIVANSRKLDTGVLLLDSFLQTSAVRVEPVSAQQALIARQCYFAFGKGRHAAGLNFGDCFSYALAKATGEPLLFKGDDFSKTDVISALP